MPASSKLYLKPSLSNTDIVQLILSSLKDIKSNPDLELPRIFMGPTSYGDHFFMEFHRNAKSDVGMLMISSDLIGGIPVRVISGESKAPEIKLFKHMALRIGGLFAKNESGLDLIEYEQPETISNIDFQLNDILMGGPTYDPSNAENHNKRIDRIIEDLQSIKK